jgi:WD40 repeat protein
MSHIFISYSRKDLDFAQKIVDALAANNLNTWVDWKSIPYGEDWEQEIYRGIEEADAFLFLISPDSVVSEMCNKEITHAVKNGKRILPIFIVNMEDKEVYNVTGKFLKVDSKEEINRRNFIFCREERDDFNKAIEEIQITIHTDYEWLKYHTRLQVKALDWEKNNYDNSFLLSGKDLEAGETELTRNASKEPYSTDLQHQYILVSRRRQDNTRRFVMIGLAIVTITMVILAIISERNALEARTQSENVRNLYLADKANKLLDDHNPDLALALALYANQKDINQKSFWTEKIMQLIGLQPSGVSPEAPYQALTDAAYLSLSTNSFRICGQGWAFSVDISRNGQYAVVACDDPSANVQEAGNIILFDLKSGKEINHIRPGDWVYSVEFSPNSKNILSGDSENQAMLWNLNGNLLKTFKGHAGAVHSARFNSEGDLIATASFDGSVIIWEVATGRDLYRTEGLGSPILATIFRPGYTQLVFGDSDGNVVVWDFAAEVFNYEFGSHSAAVLSLAYDPIGNYLASGGADGKIKIWKTSESYLQKKIELNGQSGWIYSLAFLSSGTELISGASDRSLILWDISSGEIRQRMDGHTDEVQSVSIDTMDHFAVSAARDGTIRIWDLKSLFEFAFAKDPDIGEMLRILPVIDYGLSLATTSSRGQLQLWMTSPNITSSNTKLSEYPLTGLARYPDRQKILISTQAGNLMALNLQTWQVVQTFSGHRGVIRDVAVSPNGDLSIAAFADGNIVAWDSETGQILCTLVGHTNIVNSIAFAPDGKNTLVSGSNDHLALEWNLDTCKDGSSLSPTRSFTGHDFWVMDVAVSADGRYLATASGDQSVILWDLGSGRQIHRMRLDRLTANPGQELYMLGVAFSPDGKTVLSSSATGDVLLWSVASGKLLRHFIQKPNENCTLGDRCRWAWDVAFSDDGNIAYASFADGTWHAWNLIPAHDIKSLASWISQDRFVRPLTDQEKVLYEINQ